MIPIEKIETYRESLRHKLSRQLTASEQAELEQAYHEANVIAQRLIQEHRADCVWLVGSVARRRPLRPDSDIDLVVEGMPSENYLKLAGDLLTDSGRSVDLIQLEHVRPAAKQMFLSEGIILVTATDNINYLITAIEAKIEHFQRLANDVAESVARFLPVDQVSIHDLRAIALLLTEIYLGAENLMLRIAKSLDEPIPSGKAWHAELLEQFSKEAQPIRPGFINEDTLSQRDEFRRFRHMVHHTYTFDYDWQQIKSLLGKADTLLTKLIRDAQAFRTFLLDTIADKNE